jgi:hypothetical protein
MRLMILALTFLFGGCSIMTSPMVRRLDPWQQEMVDKAWVNVLDHGKQVDRELLLDVIVHYQLISIGMDTVDYRAVKTVGDRRIVLESKYDRYRPREDKFTISVLNERGKLLRRESYERSDIERAESALRNGGVGKKENPTPEDLERQRQYEARVRMIEAATQPARR